MEVQDRYLVLFCLFSVVGGFEWFWMESLHSNIQLMTDILKAPFLVLHFLYYTLMTLMMLSVILLFMLIILLYTLSLIMHLIFGNKWSWLLNLNLICETLKWDRKWLVNFNTLTFSLGFFCEVSFSWGCPVFGKSSIFSMEYCCCVCVVARSWYLEMLDKLQKQIVRLLVLLSLHLLNPCLIVEV